MYINGTVIGHSEEGADFSRGLWSRGLHQGFDFLFMPSAKSFVPKNSISV